MGPFRWNSVALRYIDANGRFVSRDAVRLALDQTLRSIETDAFTLADQLQAGEIGLAEWRIAMRDLVKESHILSSAAAKGGRAQLTYGDYGRVGQILAHGRSGGMGEFEYLERFAREIQGGLPLDGRFRQRTRMYVQAARGTYHTIDSAMHEAQGFDEERSVRLSSSDSCVGCIGAEALQWQPIGALPEIGTRNCLANCNCTMQYRKSSRGRRAA